MLEICKDCLIQEMGDSSDTGVIVGNQYIIVEYVLCQSMRHEEADDNS